MKKRDNESTVLICQFALTGILTLSIIVLDIIFEIQSLWIGLNLLFGIFVYFKLMSIKNNGSIHQPKRDKAANAVAWLVFVWTGGFLGWIILLIGEICSVIYFLLQFMFGLANS